MKKDHFLFFLVFLSSVVSVGAQTVNKGKLYIKPGSIVSTRYSFENKQNADFRNNGTFYAYQNITNNGAFFDFKGNKPQGTTILGGDKLQTISGTSLLQMNDLVLNNATALKAFDVKANVAIHGNVEFANGIGVIDPSLGVFTFMPNAHSLDAKDVSHLEGEIEKEGFTDFVFPQGDKGLYRPATIIFETKLKDVFVSEYRLKDTSFFDSRSTKSGIIEQIDTNEYWKVEHVKKANSDIVLTLSWDKRTTPQDLLGDDMKDLHIVRWDEEQKLWKDEGGIVDLENRTVTTPTTVKGYGYFTFGRVKSELFLKGDVVVYNYVSLKEDNHNDYFLIENIRNHPNNKVEIFNRWGVKVYETTNYDTQGNVFKGVSEGRVTIAKNEKLPSGTYYYILQYELRDKNGAQMLKKAGYLHLEAE